jgi:hypothetical protein
MLALFAHNQAGKKPSCTGWQMSLNRIDEDCFESIHEFWDFRGRGWT